MAKLIFRTSTNPEWMQLKREDLTVEEMRDRLNAYPFEDCGFMGEMMDQMYGSPHVTVELWDTNFMSLKSGVLVIEATWTYFHDRHERHIHIHVMEGEL